MKWTIRNKLLAGFISVLVLVSILSSVNNYYMNSVEKEASLIQSKYYKGANLASEIQLEVIQVWQWLTDISATQGAEGFDDGYDEAEQHAQKFKELIAALKVVMPEQSEQVLETEKSFDEFYEMGKKMAAAYISGGHVEGNKFMLGFDSYAEDISERLETLKVTNQELIAAKLGSINELISFSSVVGLSISLTTIAIGLIIAVFTARLIVGPINKVVEMIKDVAEGEGDLTKRLEVNTNDEIGELSTWFNTFMDKLHSVISQVKANAIEVSSASTEIASAAEQAAAGANEQTAQTGEVATSVEQMTATILESAQNTNQATDSAKQAADVATEGGNIVQQAIQGMTAITNSVSASAVTIGELGKRSDEIGEIIEVIDDIADQTNLLALNAAIEAARAGEQGRGFAVVADEVRKLAERTTKATAEIAGMIKGIQQETSGAVESMEEASKQVEDGTELTAKAGDSLTQIVTVVAEVQNMIAQIATASDEQSAAAEQISGNVAGISSVSQQTAQGSAQIATAAEQLNRQTEALDVLVNQFKLDESTEAV